MHMVFVQCKEGITLLYDEDMKTAQAFVFKTTFRASNQVKVTRIGEIGAKPLRYAFLGGVVTLVVDSVC